MMMNPSTDDTETRLVERVGLWTLQEVYSRRPPIQQAIVAIHLAWRQDCIAIAFDQQGVIMSVSIAQSDRLWSQFRALPQESRDAFLHRLVTDAAIREEIEDLLDSEIAIERSHEPSRPLRDLLDELDS
jgi:hypothetical protein